MTEATPVTHFSRLKSSTLGDLPEEARYSYKAKQGTLVPGLEQRVVDGDGAEVPADGKSMGELQLVDRTKDLVKSGGEWISSVELENALMGHPEVAEAAVIAVPDPKWAERPLAVVVRKAGSEVSEAELVASIAGRLPKWWLPDRVEFVNELPKTATGKFSKRTLRERFVGGVREEEGSDER